MYVMVAKVNFNEQTVEVFKDISTVARYVGVDPRTLRGRFDREGMIALRGEIYFSDVMMIKSERGGKR